MTLLRKRALVAVSLESTVGTAASPAADDAAMYAFDIEHSLDVETFAREYPGTMSQVSSAIGGRQGTVSFKVEVRGPGADANPKWADRILPSIGMVATGRAFSVDTSAPGTVVTVNRTVTVSYYKDGTMFQLAGCMGTGKFVFEMGNRAYLEVTYTGKFVAVTDTALLSPTAPESVAIPRCANLTATLAAAAIGASPRIEIDLGNTVVLREDISSTGGASGYSHAVITNRDVKCTIEFDSVLVATNDRIGKFVAGTLEAFALSIDGGDAWNQMDFAAPKAQIVEDSLSNRDDIFTDSITLLFTRSAANDDEFSLTFVA